MSTQPSLGHLHPCLGMARYLRDAGHEVALASAPGMTPHIRAAGITPLAIGFDIPLGGDPAPGGEEAEEACSLAGAGLRRWVDDLAEHAATWSPDVMMRDWLEGSGLVVAERLKIPSVVLGLMVPPSADHLRELLRRVLDFEPPRQRSSPEPSAHDDLARIRGDLLLDLYPPSLALPDVPPLAHEHHIQPPYYDGAEAMPLPGWLGELDEAPLIYVSLGSWYNSDPGNLEAVIQAAASVDAQVIVPLGRDRRPGEFDPLPANVRLERYVPQSRLIPHCAAVIGPGFITRMTALAHGIPVGGIPPGYGFSLDSQRCEQVGAGLSYPIDDEDPAGPLILGRLDPERLHTMMVKLLEDPTYRQGAQRIQTEIHALPSTRQAVTFIESIA